jgi:hypothetical protein
VRLRPVTSTRVDADGFQSKFSNDGNLIHQGDTVQFRHFVLVFAMALLSACATVPANAPTYRPVADAPAGWSNLYIYRLGAYPRLRTPAVSVDDGNVFDPPEGAFTVVRVPSGPHEVTVHWSWDTGWPNLKFQVATKSGGATYLKISGSFDTVGAGYFRAGSYANVVRPEFAEQELRNCCRYIPPKSNAVSDQ